MNCAVPGQTVAMVHSSLHPAAMEFMNGFCKLFPLTVPVSGPIMPARRFQKARMPPEPAPEDLRLPTPRDHGQNEPPRHTPSVL